MNGIASALEGFLAEVSASLVAEFVSFAILAAFVTALYCLMKAKAKEFVSYTPALLTSLGIFGTFTGIVIGLLAFDPANIDGSIEHLLNGLKTAFITSLVGIILSIVFKITQTIVMDRQSKDAVNITSATPEDILGAMVQQGKSLEKLSNAIGGESDGSILSQMKLLRGDINDNQKIANTFHKESTSTLRKIDKRMELQKEGFDTFSDKLWIKMQDFADMLSKSATETVIEALKQVITDFNKNLTEQFGENFKQLNSAVKELVTWQDNYKTQLSEMMEQYKLGVSAITATEASVASISEESKVIPQTMTDLKTVMEVNQHQLSELENHLEAFKDIRDRAVEAVPEIRKQIDETVKVISESVVSASEHYEKLLTSSDKYIQTHIDTSNQLLEKFVTNTKEGVDLIGSRIGECAEDFTKNITRTNESLQSSSDHVASTTETIKGYLKDAVSDLNEHVRDMINGLVEDSKAMSSTLKEANTALITDTKSVRENVTQNIDGMQKQLENSMEEVLSSQTQHMNKVFSNIDAGLKEQVGKTGEAVEKQLSILDQSMQQELNTVMNGMAKALGQISNQFVSDYSKLVNEMKAVVAKAV